MHTYRKFAGVLIACCVWCVMWCIMVMVKSSAHLPQFVSSWLLVVCDVWCVMCDVWCVVWSIPRQSTVSLGTKEDSNRWCISWCNSLWWYDHHQRYVLYQRHFDEWYRVSQDVLSTQQLFVVYSMVAIENCSCSSRSLFLLLRWSKFENIGQRGHVFLL